MTSNAKERAMEEKIERRLKDIQENKGALIPLLQTVQSELGYISPEAVKAASNALGISESEVYGVATFYSEFRLRRPGKHDIKVCLGTSCYLKGGRRLLEHLTKRLCIRSGETTADGKFSLETVACLGCCSRSPVISIDGITYGNVTPSRADSILASL